MPDDIETILLHLRGKALPQGDSRRPQILRSSPDRVLLIPSSSDRFPNLVIHLSETFPWGAPDVYVPGDMPIGLIPHVNSSGLVCCRAYRVFANPFRPQEVIERVIQEAVAILDQSLTPQEESEHFLAEAQAYWVKLDTTRFHYLPSLLEHTFLFQCKEGFVEDVKILEAHDIEPYVSFVGFRIDVPPAEIKSFLEAPAKWLVKDKIANDTLLHGLQALAAHTPHPKAVTVVFAFRIQTPNGVFVLAAEVKQKLQLLRPLKAPPNAWLKLFHEKTHEFVQIASEDMSSRRLLRRSMGAAATQSPLFAAASSTRLGVIGCGSLGSHIVTILLQGGIQTMYLVDNDRLLPENFARHALSAAYRYEHKGQALLDQSKRTYREAKISGCGLDIRRVVTQEKLFNWGPTLLLCAAADENVEMLLSELVARGRLPGAWFCWVEPDLAAGHLVYQPAGQEPTLVSLHEAAGDNWVYRYRVSADDSPDGERECGCQTAFTPFSGADAALFSAICARKILETIAAPPSRLTAFRWIPGSGGLEEVA